MKLYRNDENKRLIASMLQRGREPHSVVITGVRGSGKKELAKYLAAAMLCEKHSGYPCGECRSCLMLEHGNHPDFITVKPNENGNYQLDTVRALVSDAVIKPNEGALKVYVLPDLDRSVSTAAAVQNVLLKLIEEPPDHCVIIITAATREIFLPTVLSRVQRFETQPCSVHDAEEWLTMLGRFGQDDIIRAVEPSSCDSEQSAQQRQDLFVCVRELCKEAPYRPVYFEVPTTSLKSKHIASLIL